MLFYLVLITATLMLSLKMSNNFFLFLLCVWTIMKLMQKSNHLLLVLLSIEVLSILVIYIFMTNNQVLLFNTASPMTLFTFLVVTASMGVALLINQTRQISRQSLRLLFLKQ